ncbi:hypothetical protein OAI26_09715 [Sulfitobacter sp.]|nr:hypothetical protein [Sulfitobacter sp.]
MTIKKVSGLVIGTRKTGTTWLYENMCRDHRVSLSGKVKESGFFTGSSRLDEARYHGLFDSKEDAPYLEVDTSVCYSQGAPDCIEQYNPEMRIVLIFREPGAFLASRHTHSLRKGELSEAYPAEALAANTWLRAELDYPAITERFARFGDRLSIFKYSQVEEDPVGFYSDVLSALSISDDGSFIPETQPVNVSRDSRLRVVSTLLSKGAITARHFGLHRLVNGLKSLDLHKRLELHNDDARKSRSGDLAAHAVAKIMPDTLRFYNTL